MTLGLHHSIWRPCVSPRYRKFAAVNQAHEFLAKVISENIFNGSVQAQVPLGGGPEAGPPEVLAGDAGRSVLAFRPMPSHHATSIQRDPPPPLQGHACQGARWFAILFTIHRNLRHSFQSFPTSPSSDPRRAYTLPRSRLRAEPIPSFQISSLIRSKSSHFH